MNHATFSHHNVAPVMMNTKDALLTLHDSFEEQWLFKVKAIVAWTSQGSVVVVEEQTKRKF